MIRCAIYTRKSSEEGLEQSFNSLDAQREACEAYILSQRHEGWNALPTKYDDGGFSGGNIERPGLKRLLADVAAKKVDTVVVYKVDRLTRSLADFAKIVEQFDGQGVSFVSVTQQFNTTTSMGRLTLNLLLSFAQFEREVTGERIRDKIAASKRKGMWMGGVVPMGYDLDDRKLVVNPEEALQVEAIFSAYLKQGYVSKLQEYLQDNGINSKKRLSKTGNASGGNIFSRGALYLMLQNRVYLGEITHKDASYPGQQPAIIKQDLWDRVQTQLKGNLQGERRRPRSSDKSLLTGLIYDADGNPFTPTHANKKGRRYRYYVLQAALKKAAKIQTGPVRLPSDEIEELVVVQLRRFLESPQRVLEMLGDSPTSLQESKQLLDGLNKLADRVRELIPSLVHKVIVHADRVEIQISRVTLLGMLRHKPPDDGDATHQQFITVSVAASLKRHGGEVRLQLPPDEQGAKSRPVPSLIRAVARANDWVDRVLKGEFDNVRRIAKATGFDERYVSRILPLAFLAPDLTEAILEGRKDSHLGKCIGEVFLDWPSQRLNAGARQIAS
jgi:site-specific DNA recombinase